MLHSAPLHQLRSTSPNNGRDADAPKHASSFDIIVQHIASEEAEIRRGLASATAAAPMHPGRLLKFASSCIAAARALVDSTSVNGTDAAEAVRVGLTIASHAETLLRFGVESRRRYSSEDWLNLSRDFLRHASRSELDDVESERRALHLKSLHLIGQLFFVAGDYDDSQCAMEDALYAALTVDAPLSGLSDTLTLERGAYWWVHPAIELMGTGYSLNLLAVRERAQRASVSATLHAACEVVAAVEEEMVRVMTAAPRAAVEGTFAERQAFSQQRLLVARMLVTSHLRKLNAGVQQLRERLQEFHRFSLSGSLTHLALLQVTAGFAELQRLVHAELEGTDTLVDEVHAAINQWSELHAHVCAAASGGHSNERHMAPADRWKYQLSAAKQLLAQHPAPAAATPSLSRLCARYPHHAGLSALVASGSLHQSTSRQRSTTRELSVTQAAGAIDGERTAPGVFAERREETQTYVDDSGAGVNPSIVASLEAFTLADGPAGDHSPAAPWREDSQPTAVVAMPLPLNPVREANSRSSSSGHSIHSSPSAPVPLHRDSSALLDRNAAVPSNALRQFKQRAFDVCGQYLLSQGGQPTAVAPFGRGEQAARLNNEERRRYEPADVYERSPPPVVPPPSVAGLKMDRQLSYGSSERETSTPAAAPVSLPAEPLGAFSFATNTITQLPGRRRLSHFDVRSSEPPALRHPNPLSTLPQQQK